MHIVQEVLDNGRGIPTGKHPTQRVPTPQVVFGALYNGGKFNKSDAGAAYRFSGELHGVGVAVSKALSLRLECRIRRSGKEFFIAFEKGEVAEPLRAMGKSNKTRTLVWFKSDPDCFDSPEIPVSALAALVRNKAVLLPDIDRHTP